MANWKILNFVVVAALLVLGLGCTKEVPLSPSPTATANTNLQIFQVKGVVQELKPAEKTVVIKHEEIPGFMEPMTMPLEVKAVKELDGLQPGDSVTFRMIVTKDEGWIDQIRKIAEATPIPPAPTETFRRVRMVEPLSVGDALPDYHFTNELGQKMSFAQFRGQALAFTFLFTRCPFPNFCPRMSTHFAAVQNKLKAMPNAPTNWHLLTISFDPEFDTPAALKAYAKGFGADPARWNFLTGEMIDIDAITEQVGLLFVRQEGTINHNLRTVVVDAQGHIQRIIPENKWEPDELVEEILKAAAIKPADAQK